MLGRDKLIAWLNHDGARAYQYRRGFIQALVFADIITHAEWEHLHWQSEKREDLKLEVRSGDDGEVK